MWLSYIDTKHVYIGNMIGNASDWLFYAGGALMQMVASAGSPVYDPDRATTLCPLTWMK